VVGSTAAGTSTKPRSFKRVSDPTLFSLGSSEMELHSRCVFRNQPGASSSVIFRLRVWRDELMERVRWTDFGRTLRRRRRSPKRRSRRRSLRRSPRLVIQLL
jgi:hypothetical protein